MPSVNISGNPRPAACCMFQICFRGTTELHSPSAASITEWTAGSAASDEMVCTHTHTGPFAFIPLTPDCTSLLCPMSATANALLSWSLQFQNSCRVDVIYCTGSCQACAMTDLCSFWRWVQANCWSHPCCIVLQLPGPVPTSRRWRMR